VPNPLAPTPDEPQPRSWSTPATWLLAAVMAAVAAALVVPTWVERPSAAVPHLSWLALLPLFALAEVAVIHLPTQRNAHGHTLREIPAVLGLTFLAPEQYVTAYVVGAALALVVAARMRGLKLAFNAAMFALEAALGATTYHAILQGGDPLSVHGWLAVLAAVLVTDLISAAAVTAAISLAEGEFDGDVLHEAMTSGSIAAFINTCVALLVATLVIVRPSALPLLAVPVVLLVLGYRVYVSLARGHAQTRLLYRFVDRTSAALSHHELVDVVLAEAAELMHAEHAFLVELTEGSDARMHGWSGHRLPSGSVEDVRAVWWGMALESGVVRHERPRHLRGVEATRRTDPLADPRDGLAAPLRGDGTTRFVLVVCDRSFEKETFGPEDVEVFEALAAHAGVALEKARGVSDLEALAGQLSVARDEALAASEAKSLFLANMSHEIRTPLTIMLATAEMLEDTELDAEQRAMLERMQRRGGSLRTLVESILDFSRIESGQVELSSKPFDLPALVADLTDVYQPRATRAGLLFGTHVDPRVPRTVVGDVGRLFQVLSNLLDNSLKFTHQGQVDLMVRPGEQGDLEIVVRDTGIGIAATHQEAVFEVFSQVDPTTTRRYEGTGLGLAICRQLTSLMGGTVLVESRPGVGSAFTVRLPLIEALTRPQRAADHVGQTGRSSSILSA
jgi:signal transduction histidine kinase